MYSPSREVKVPYQLVLGTQRNTGHLPQGNPSIGFGGAPNSSFSFLLPHLYSCCASPLEFHPLSSMCPMLLGQQDMVIVF